MRIAILVGVAEYNNKIYNLPAVVNDVTSMENLLRATGRFSEIITLKGRIFAEECKTSLPEKLQNHHGSSVEEVLFYFSGHGDLRDGGLVFPMSDFSESQWHQTSVQDSELDDWLRLLSPRVTVKVLDCCHSGTLYIKSVTDFKAALEASKRRFETCYFFFSSHREQPSYADTKGSFFTRKFLCAIRTHPNGPIRYRKIIDYLADAFDGNDQQPQFAAQGSMLDVFCEVNETVRSSIPEEQLQDFPNAMTPEQTIPLNLQQAIEGDALCCISKGEAEEVLRHVRELVEGIAFPDLHPFYDIAPKFVEQWDDEKMAGEKIIGKWLKDKGRNFFGLPVESKPRQLTAIEAAVMSPTARPSERPSVTGFVTTDDLPYDRIIFRASPKFPNLTHWELAVLFLWSHRNVVIFHYSTALESQNWSEQRNPNVNWQPHRLNRSRLTEIPSYVEALAKRFGALILESLNQQFLPSKTK